jgi:hypothetical protein
MGQRETRASSHPRCSSLRALGVATLAVACLAPVTLAETIRMGGPREVVVDVADADGGFAVNVEMRPVACFDQATNARVNRSKACLYGLLGLAKALDIDSGRLSTSRSVSGVAVDTVSADANRYRLRFFVPEAGIGGESQQIGSDGDAEDTDTTSAQPAKRSQLFTCVTDYETTIAGLQTSSAERLSDTLKPVQPPADPADSSPDFEGVRVKIKSVGKDAGDAFAAVGREVHDDLRLLTIEKESLGKMLAEAQRRWDASVAEAVSEVDVVEKLHSAARGRDRKPSGSGPFAPRDAK